MKSKIFTPVVSIFNDNEEFDIDGNIKVMEYLIKGGVDGIVPLGTTGEYPGLHLNKKIEYLNKYIEAVNNRVELIIGTGSVNYKDIVTLSNHIFSQNRHNIKGVLVISEFYYNMNQNDFYNYYSYMAESINGNIYIYNYPDRTGNSIEADTIVKLVQNFNNIVGLKDSVSDFSHTKEILEKVLKVKNDFEVFSGFDNQFLDNKKYGGCGGISAISNFAPDLWNEWVKASNNNDEYNIKKCGDKIDGLMKLYSLESNPQKIFKEILKYYGIDINTRCIFPFNNLKEETMKTAIELLKKYYR